MTTDSISSSSGRPACQAAGLFGLACMVLAGVANSADFITADLADGSTFHEVHEPEVNVSGNIIVGVMSTTALEGLRKDTIGIQALDIDTDTVCLRVTSRDGSYLSQNEYTVDVSKPSVVNLPYHTGMPDIIRHYTTDMGTIAVTATTGPCARAATAAYYLPTRLDRDKGTLDTGNVSIYINGFDATDVFFQFTDGDDDEFFDCEYIEEGRHTAYNFSCQVPSERLSASSTRTLEISREVYGRELEPVSIKLLSIGE
jgi:hypothetical protein